MEKIIQETIGEEISKEEAVREAVSVKEEAGKEHLDGTFSFILEALDGVSFGDEFHPPLVAPFETKDYRYGHATHGYLPEKGPQPVFYAKGPDFGEHVVLEHARLVDEAPTFAELLGLEFPNVQGSCLWELLKKGRGYDTNSF